MSFPSAYVKLIYGLYIYIYIVSYTWVLSTIYIDFSTLITINFELWTLSCELLNSFSCVTIAYLYVESLYRELYKLTIYMMHIPSALYIDTQISLRQCFFTCFACFSFGFAFVVCFLYWFCFSFSLWQYAKLIGRWYSIYYMVYCIPGWLYKQWCWHLNTL